MAESRSCSRVRAFRSRAAPSRSIARASGSPLPTSAEKQVPERCNAHSHTRRRHMRLNLTGHHVEVTPALRGYVEKKLLERIARHFDQVIDVHCVLTVEKLRQKAEATLHVRGCDIHADATELDMYAAPGALGTPGAVTQALLTAEQTRPYALCHAHHRRQRAFRFRQERGAALARR